MDLWQMFIGQFQLFRHFIPVCAAVFGLRGVLWYNSIRVKLILLDLRIQYITLIGNGNECGNRVQAYVEASE